METATPIEDPAQITTRWQETMLSLEKVYEQEPEVLSIGGVAIGTLGNFSASIGGKNGKTDPLKTDEGDPWKTVQTVPRKTEEIDHLKTLQIAPLVGA